MNNSHPPSNGDRTIMIPTPGARRGNAPAPSPARAYAATPITDKISLRKGLNPLVNSAITLLTLAIKLRVTLSHDKAPELHRKLTEEIRSFEQKSRGAHIPEDSVVTARYLLCTVVDEIVLNTPWGAASGWSQHSLLSLFHHETSGGEKCFTILQKLLETPGKHADLLELFYLCLSLGFEGKYRLEARGHEQLEIIRDNLYKTIERIRPNPEQDLSPHWQSDAIRPKRRMDYFPTWVVAACFATVLLLSYSTMRWWLADTTAPIANHILEQAERK